MKLGADMSAAAGPVGRDLQGAVTTTAAVYTYSRSKGLFAGVSLEGAIIGTQKTANARYYGRVVSARSILSGRVAPAAARPAARPSRPLLGGRRFSFTGRKRLRQGRPRACAPAVLCLTISAACSAQEQENKLVDRLLKPDMSLANSAQDKQFTGTGTTTVEKKFDAKSFYAGNERTDEELFRPERFFREGFETTKFTRAEKAANIQCRAGLCQHEVHDRGKLTRPPAAEDDKVAQTREYAESRPFLGEGTRQKILSQQDKPLTIDEIRELLNKSK